MATKKRPRREPIEDVLGRHDLEWMKIPGVVGAGIGAGSSPARSKVLKVYVSAAAGIRDRIPAAVDGYAVEIEETGEFHTLPA